MLQPRLGDPSPTHIFLIDWEREKWSQNFSASVFEVGYRKGSPHLCRVFTVNEAVCAKYVSENPSMSLIWTS